MIKFNTLLANCVIFQIALFTIQKRGRAFASFLALLKGGGMIETAAARSLRDSRRGEPSLSLSLSGALLAHDELASNGRGHTTAQRVPVAASVAQCGLDTARRSWLGSTRNVSDASTMR